MFVCFHDSLGFFVNFSSTSSSDKMPDTNSPESNYLRFRSFESPQDDQFFLKLQSNSVAAFRNSNWHLLRPVNRDTTTARGRPWRKTQFYSPSYAARIRKPVSCYTNEASRDWIKLTPNSQQNSENRHRNLIPQVTSRLVGSYSHLGIEHWFGGDSRRQRQFFWGYRLDPPVGVPK